jgi:hypothetical protein
MKKAFKTEDGPSHSPLQGKRWYLFLQLVLHQVQFGELQLERQYPFLTLSMSYDALIWKYRHCDLLAEPHSPTEKKRVLLRLLV